MPTTDIPGRAGLQDVAKLSGVVHSVYFRMPVGGESTAARRHAVVKRLSDQGTHSVTLLRINEALCDVRPGRGTAGIFFNRRGESHTVVMPGAGIADRAATSSLPDLLPVMAWRQASPAHVLAVLDQAGADITVHPGEGAGATTTQVVSPEGARLGTASGEMPKDELRRRLEASSHRTAAHAARAVADAMRASGSRLLLLAGDARMTALVCGQLPSAIGHKTIVRRVSGERGHDTSHALRAEQIARAVAESAQTETRRLLNGLAERGGPGGPAVEGTAAVLHALARGRVGTLIVTDFPGDDRIAWFGDHTADLSGHRHDIERLGVRARHGRLVDVVVRAAIRTGAGVRVLRPGTAGAPAQGLGALCRAEESPTAPGPSTRRSQEQGL